MELAVAALDSLDTVGGLVIEELVLYLGQRMPVIEFDDVVGTQEHNEVPSDIKFVYFHCVFKLEHFS